MEPASNQGNDLEGRASKPLPAYSEDHLRTLNAERLIDLIIHDEDRVPRNVVEFCARREGMLEALQQRLAAQDPGTRTMGEWWLNLHAAMIFGLMPAEEAGRDLAALMRRFSVENDEDLQDWLAGHWPVLFANKPDAVQRALRELAADRGLDWYIRVNVLEPLLAVGMREGMVQIDETLTWIASLAADESEDWDFRLFAAGLLIDFPREGNRALLEGLAKRQRGLGRHFSREDIDEAFTAGKDKAPWLHLSGAWDFYLPEAISERQQRWAEEDARAEARAAGDDIGDEDPFGDGDDFDTPGATYFRPAPKVGRNDPCPCGSGRKYKKCCLPKDQAPPAIFKNGS